MEKLNNFGYAIVEARALEQPQACAVRFSRRDAVVMEMSRADLEHHSNMTACYLQRIGVAEGARVLLLDVEHSFELALLFTALAKLGATALVCHSADVVAACNSYDAYAIVANSATTRIAEIDRRGNELLTVEMKIAFGMPTPDYWFDLHTAVRAAKRFHAPTLNIRPETPLLICADNRKEDSYRYFEEPNGNTAFDNFVRAQIEGRAWDLREE